MSRLELTESLNEKFAETATDSIDVRAAGIRSSGDVGSTLAALADSLCHFRMILVDARDLTLSERDRASMIRAATIGVRVVVAATSPLSGFPPMLVLHENDFPRALVASIYNLPPAQSLFVLTPIPAGSIRGLVRHAMRWRASWRDPEEGDFRSNPA